MLIYWHLAAEEANVFFRGPHTDRQDSGAAAAGAASGKSHLLLGHRGIRAQQPGVLLAGDKTLIL